MSTRDWEKVARRVRSPTLGVWRAALCLLCVPVCGGAADEPASTATNRPFRLVFTSSMFTEVNETDARAAMKVWIMTVAKDRDIPVEPAPHIYATMEELMKDCRTNPVDGIGLTTPEYARLSQEMKFDRFAVGVHGGSATDEYVLLVRQDSRLERIDQLRGRSLNVLENPRMSLALIWLDTVLLQAHLKRAAEFLGRVSSFNNPSRVALPVFFRQTDACLMTRKSFSLMGELNPQLHKQMRILAASPEVVASGFAFRQDFVSPYRAQMLEEMTRLGNTPVGRQILTLTQADRIEDQPVSFLDSALELLATHAKLCAATKLAQSDHPGAPPSTSP